MVQSAILSQFIKGFLNINIAESKMIELINMQSQALIESYKIPKNISPMGIIATQQVLITVPTLPIIDKGTIC